MRSRFSRSALRTTRAAGGLTSSALRAKRTLATKSDAVVPHVASTLRHGGDLKIIRPGGRASVSGIVATVFGASGFVGRYLVSNLGRVGSQVIVPYRGDGMNVRHLKLAGDLGQVVPVPVDLADEESVMRAVARSNVVINLAGSRNETVHYDYMDVHQKVAYRIAKIAKEAGVERFVHVSALGASEDSSSSFFRSKFAGEEAVKSIYPDATILRPAPVFGWEDYYLNRMAAIMNFSVFYPDFGGMLSQKVQPLWVNDLARAIYNSITAAGAQGKTYELGGPEVFTQREVVEFVRSELWRDRPTFWVPGIVGDVVGYAFGRLPKDAWRIFTPDHMAQSDTDLVVSRDALGMADLGVKPQTLATQGPPILLRHRGQRGPQVQGHIDRASHPNQPQRV